MQNFYCQSPLTVESVDAQGIEASGNVLEYIDINSETLDTQGLHCNFCCQNLF